MDLNDNVVVVTGAASDIGAAMARRFARNAHTVVPQMLRAGRGWLLNTASAAGLRTAPGDGPYAVTKHAAVAFAEWRSVTYRDRGIGTGVLCPLGVATALLLIRPHPKVGTFWAQNASDPDRRLTGVRRLAAQGANR